MVFFAKTFYYFLTFYYLLCRKKGKPGLKSHSSVGIGGLSNKFKRYMRVDFNAIRSSIARAPTQILTNTPKGRGAWCNATPFALRCRFSLSARLFVHSTNRQAIGQTKSVKSVIFSDSTTAFVDFNDWRTE